MYNNLKLNNVLSFYRSFCSKINFVCNKPRFYIFIKEINFIYFGILNQFDIQF